MDSNDTDDTCRICLVRGNPVISVFDFHGSLQYSHKIMHCAGIRISELEDLPSVICKQCQSELTVAYEFVVKCQNSDSNLRKSYQLKYVKLHRVEEVPIKYENDSDATEFEDDRLEEEFNSLIMVKEESLHIEFVDENTDKIPETVTKKTERQNTLKDVPDVPKIFENKVLPSDKSSERCSKITKGNIACEVCGLLTKSQAVLICHMRKHTGEKPFICPSCGTGFARKGALQMHIKRRHSENKNVKQFACEKCGKLFICRTEMKIHLRTHTGETPYACEYCQKRFTQLSNLIGHRRIHTGERPYSCTICQKTFNDKSVLNRHALVHSKKNPFTCNVCGKSVKTQSSLLGHIAVQHTGVNPVICDQCGTVCKTKGNLNSHLKNVHSSKAGTCTVCSKTFGDLASHMRRHTGEDTLSCKICDKKFSHRQSLTIHMKTHADKLKYDE